MVHRTEGIEEGTVMLVGLGWQRHIVVFSHPGDQLSGKQWLINLVDNYRSTNVSEKVVWIVLSYTGYINCLV